MFNLETWLKTTMLQAYKDGEFSEAYIAVKCADYQTKNVMSAAAVAEVAAAVETYKAEIAAASNTTDESNG